MTLGKFSHTPEEENGGPSIATQKVRIAEPVLSQDHLATSTQTCDVTPLKIAQIEVASFPGLLGPGNEAKIKAMFEVGVTQPWYLQERMHRCKI